VIDVELPTMRGAFAGFVSRSVAFVIDCVIVVIGFAIFGALAGAVMTILDFATVQIDGAGELLAWAGAIVLFFFWYYTVLIAVFGKTIGMMLMGLRVVGASGTRPAPARAAVRTAAMALSTILMLGYLWVAVDNRRQGWHDKIAKTFVIYDWEARRGTLHSVAIDEPLVPHG
jgi:uncharacterized RDD family membrane protein YckC